MTIRKISIATLLLLCLPTFAQMILVEDAVETSPSNIIVPATINGWVTFKPCAGECEAEYKRARLTGETKFVVNGKAVKFDAFRRDHFALRHSDDSYALVNYEPETNAVIRIEISR